MEFQVSEMLSEGLYSGRNCGDEIPVGFLFGKLAKYQFIGAPISLQRLELGEILNINLKILGVEFCGREIECVPKGHTALIRLEGNGNKVLLTELSRLKQHEYISLMG